MHLPFLPGRLRSEVARNLPPILKWASDSYFGKRHPATGNEKCAVVLLSFHRPDNIAPLVRSLLRCDFVGHVLVSNNNPAVRIADYVGTQDPRVRVVQQARPTGQGIRIPLAASLTDYEYLATIDDDVFLAPEQVHALLQATIANPNAIHGVMGERRTRPDEWPTRPDKDYPYVLGVGREGDFEGELDHLTNAYFFTRRHALRALALAKRFGLGDMEKLGNGEDLLLSASGRHRPRVHRVGPIVTCYSSLLGEVSTCLKEDFFDERKRLIEILRPVFEEQTPAGQPTSSPS